MFSSILSKTGLFVSCTLKKTQSSDIIKANILTQYTTHFIDDYDKQQQRTKVKSFRSLHINCL